MQAQKQLVLPKGTKVPDHIALIPDGNRRWARARGLNTLEGHKKGFERATELARVSRSLGIHTATLWGFSTENWDRSKTEIDYLMKLYEKLIDNLLEEAQKEKVRIVHLGRKDRLPTSLIKKITEAQEKTAHNEKHIINVGIDYGGRDEIIRATKNIVRDNVPENMIDETLFAKYLDTANQPYPYVDLLIRTSGEQRTSGFMLWQMPYAEIYWEQGHFPGFTPEKLVNAVLDYSRRRRRFGANDAVEHFTFEPKLLANLELSWWRLKKIPQGEGFIDYAFRHIREQYGLSKSLAKEAATHLLDAAINGDAKNWEKTASAFSKFYKLIKDEIKLAFEPSIVASWEVKFLKDTAGKENIQAAYSAEETARQLYAEVYRISLLQAAKAAHLRVLAAIEKNLAESGFGEKHWALAEDYLQKFYIAIKEQVA